MIFHFNIFLKGVVFGSLGAIAQSAKENFAAGSAFSVMQGSTAGCDATETLVAAGGAIGTLFGYLLGVYIIIWYCKKRKIYIILTDFNCMYIL